MSLAEEIAALTKLRDEGTLSDGELVLAKKRLLGATPIVGALSDPCERPIEARGAGGHADLLDEVRARAEADGRIPFGRGRYASSSTGLDLFVQYLAQLFLALVTCGLAQSLGYIEFQRRKASVETTLADGVKLRFRGSWAEVLGYKVGGAVLLLVTCGWAFPWIAAWGHRLEKERTHAPDGRELRFDGTGTEVLALTLVSAVALVGTLGIAWPWIAVAWMSWERHHTVVVYPAPLGQAPKEVRLRFDGTGVAYFVQAMLSLFLVVVTLGLYFPWALAQWRRWSWAATSDAESPPIAVPPGPRTRGQWVAAGLVGAVAASWIVGVLAFAGSASPAWETAPLRALRDGSNGPIAGPVAPGVVARPPPEAPRPRQPDWQPVGGPLLSIPREMDGVAWLAPSGSVASGAFRSNLAKLAFDRDPRTAWQVRTPATGRGEWIEARFDRPVHVRAVAFSTGFEKSLPVEGDLFVMNAHVRAARLIVGGAVVRELQVPSESRSVTIRGLDVVGSTVRLVVDDVWPGAKWQDLCLSEVAIYGAPSTP